MSGQIGFERRLATGVSALSLIKISNMESRERLGAAGGSGKLVLPQRAQTGQHAMLTTNANRQLSQASSSVLFPFRRERYRDPMTTAMIARITAMTPPASAASMSPPCQVVPIKTHRFSVVPHSALYQLYFRFG